MARRRRRTGSRREVERRGESGVGVERLYTGAVLGVLEADKDARPLGTSALVGVCASSELDGGGMRGGIGVASGPEGVAAMRCRIALLLDMGMRIKGKAGVTLCVGSA